MLEVIKLFEAPSKFNQTVNTLGLPLVYSRVVQIENFKEG